MAGLVPGQSNSANHAETRAEGGPGDSWYDERCHEARDSLPGASGDSGSLWTRLWPMLRAGRGRDGAFCAGGNHDHLGGAVEPAPCAHGRVESTARALAAAHRYNGCHFGSVSALLAAEAWRRALMNESPAR